MMGEALLLSLWFGAVAGLFVTVLLRPRSMPPQMWEKVARECGLTVLGAQTFTTGGDHPTPDLRIQVAGRWEGDKRIGTTIAVQCLRAGLAGLGLRPESEATALEKKRGGREVVTGDDTLDDALYLSGPDLWMRAVLDEETRRLLMSLRRDAELEIVNGELHGRVGNDVDLGGLFRGFLAAAHRLRKPADLPAALARSARSDAHPGVRRESVLALARDFPARPLTQATLRAASTDRNDGVRVRAAIALGPEGRPTLLELARAEGTSDAAAAQAFEALGVTLSVGEMTAILEGALRTRRVHTARVGMDLLARQAPADAVPVLAPVLALDNPELAAAAARALGATGQLAAEALLLAALQRDEVAVRVAAASALGHAGSISAVLPLRDLERRRRDDATRRAAREAVAAIQSRLPGASPGQLSLASAEAGALSVADDASGRVSLGEEPKR
jgi:HEAT repeat protein